MDFTSILRNVIKEQNKQLLMKIAEKYNKNYEELERKYLTPTYYSIDIDSSKIYKIDYID